MCSRELIDLDDKQEQHSLLCMYPSLSLKSHYVNCIRRVTPLLKYLERNLENLDILRESCEVYNPDVVNSTYLSLLCFVAKQMPRMMISV